MQDKKSQIQIGEIVAVLVVFFIIVLIGFVVYFSVLRGEIEERTEEARDIGSIGIVQIVLSLPELQCSDNNVVREKCVDLLKVRAFSIFPESTKKEYFGMFGFSEIKVRQVYPAAAILPWTLYSSKITDSAGNDVSGSKTRTEVPIIIHNPIGRKNNFGVLNITTYSR